MNDIYTRIANFNIYFYDDYKRNFYNILFDNKLVKHLYKKVLSDKKMMELYVGNEYCVLKQIKMMAYGTTGIFIDYIFFNDMPDYVGIYLKVYKKWSIQKTKEGDRDPDSTNLSLYNIKTNQHFSNVYKETTNFFDRYFIESRERYMITDKLLAINYIALRDRIIDNIDVWKSYIDFINDYDGNYETSSIYD